MSGAIVATQVGVQKSTVNFIANHWRHSGGLKHKTGSGRQRTSTVENDRAMIQFKPFASAVEAVVVLKFPDLVYTLVVVYDKLI